MKPKLEDLPSQEKMETLNKRLRIVEQQGFYYLMRVREQHRRFRENFVAAYHGEYKERK